MGVLASRKSASRACGQDARRARATRLRLAGRKPWPATLRLLLRKPAWEPTFLRTSLTNWINWALASHLPKLLLLPRDPKPLIAGKIPRNLQRRRNLPAQRKPAL